MEGGIATGESQAIVTVSIVDGAGEGIVHRYRRPCRVIVGRSSIADLRLFDPHISRRHILLEIAPPSCRLLELATETGGSTNIPRVNGKPVRSKDLVPGDIIDLGRTRLLFEVEWEGVPDVRAAKPEKDPFSPRDSFLHIQCPHCGCDLSRPGNSDKQALDFCGSVSYVCRQCIVNIYGNPRKLIDGYELVSEIGEGSIGTVHLAWHADTCRLFALKEINELGSEAAARRFEKEVRVLRGLSHPGIARFIDSGIHDGTSFVVTEYLPGGNLEAYRRIQSLFPSAEAVRLTVDLLDSLSYAHAWPILHRSIKPTNILLVQGAAGKPLPKLTDVGMRLFYERACGITKKVANKPTVAMRFTAPEQSLESAQASILSDIYSVGMTLYYLLTDQFPFDFATKGEMQLLNERQAGWRSPLEAARRLRRLERVMFPEEVIRREQPIPALTRCPSAPKTVAAVVDRAVRKDPAARFKNCVEFRSALLYAAAKDGLKL